MMDKKILVTGGAGFIGGNFVHYMVDKYPNYMIVNLDALTYAGNLETCQPVEGKPNYKFVKGDIADRDFIFDLFEKEKFDIVLVSSLEKAILNCFVVEMNLSNVIRKILIRKQNAVVDNIKKYFKENLRKILFLSNEYSSEHFFPSYSENLLTLSFFNPLKEDDVELKHINTLIKRIADIKKDVKEVLNEYRL